MAKTLTDRSNRLARSATGIVALLAAGAVAFAAPVLDMRDVCDKTLDNGLHIVVKHAPKWDTVSVGLCIKASPLYETEDQAGLSEAVRHFMFEVAPEGELSFADRVSDLGADFNSYTSPDATQVRLTCARQSLDDLFGLLAIAVFEPVFDEDLWAKQLPELRRKVREDQRSPLGTLFKALWETAFRKHPYGRPVTGDPDDLAAYGAEDMEEFHSALYVPGNVSLIAVGDMPPDEVFALAEKHLGHYAAKDFEAPQVLREPLMSEPRTRLEKRPSRNTVLSFGWHAPGIDNKLDVCAIDLIYAALSEGQQARLMKAFAEKEEIDALPEVEFITKRDNGLFVVTCITKPDAEFETREIVLKEIKRLRDEKITEEELAEAKALIRAAYAFDNTRYSSQVGSIAFYEAIDSYRFAIDYIDEVEKVTVDDFHRVAKQYLGDSNYALVIIRPKNPGGPVWEARLPQ